MLEQIYVSAIPQFDFLKPTSLLKVWRTKIFLSSTLFFVQVFNRDEPDREKKIHVTVKASDSGKPPLEDVCTIAVTIKDVNDNPPIFDRANYEILVPQVSVYNLNFTPSLFMLDVISTYSWLIKDFPWLNFASYSALSSQVRPDIFESILQARYPRIVTKNYLLDKFLFNNLQYWISILALYCSVRRTCIVGHFAFLLSNMLVRSRKPLTNQKVCFPSFFLEPSLDKLRLKNIFI